MFARGRLCLAVCAGLLLTSAPAHADWWLTPFAGTGFSGQVADGPRVTLGVAGAWTGASWFGVELDAGNTSDVFSISDTTSPLFDRSRVSTVMANALFTSPRAWWGDRVRPYGVVGVGAVHTRIGQDDDFIRVSNTHRGVTLGGGVTSMIEKHFGIRADVRYMRDLQRLESDSEFFSLGERHVDFWRGTVGAVIRF